MTLFGSTDTVKIDCFALMYILKSIMLGKLTLACSVLQIVTCGRAPTWDICNCRWDTWKPWSACTQTCGGGQQYRQRSVWSHDIPGCDKFENCASSDLGLERRICNSVCYHGGSFKVQFGTLGYCHCLKGNRGSCCEQVVNCGAPSKVSHGKVSGREFTYGHTVHYTCEADFNMTNPSDATRTCSEGGYWTGRSPTCLYAVSCSSNPCRNGATCTNNLGGYDCTCLPGWTGKNCEIDIQPPVFDLCPKNKTIYTSNLTHLETWTAPTYKDPFGGAVVVTKNYANSSFTFPWGHYTVQYTGTKPSNGLSTECTFTIAIQPHPCIPLEGPVHGIVACNNWQTNYSSICKLLCKKGYTYPPGFSDDNWYVCAASGNWFPAVKLSQCVSQELHITGTKSSTFECHNTTHHENVAEYYVRSLKASNFNNLCENHLTECHEGNVFVNC